MSAQIRLISYLHDRPTKLGHRMFTSAGQECPSLSGLPMAFGAGYKIYDREKKPHKRSDSKALSDPPATTTPNGGLVLSSSPELLLNHLSSSPNNHIASASDLALTSHNAPHPGGWSYLLDDWLVRGNKTQRRKSSSPIPGVNGVDSAPPHSPTSVISDSSKQPWLSPSAGVITKPPGSITSSDPSEVDNPGGLAPPHIAREALMTRSITEPVGDAPIIRRPVPPARSGTNFSPVKAHSTPAEANPSVGPYELAVKERMMGIYLAVYVHRDLKHLVKGQ